MAQFLYFLLMIAKRWPQFGYNIYVHLKDLIELLQEVVWLMGVGITVREISRVEI